MVDLIYLVRSIVLVVGFSFLWEVLVVVLAQKNIGKERVESLAGPAG
jgi:hypothetical protein